MGFPDNFWRNLGWVVSILRFDCHKWNSYYTNHHFFSGKVLKFGKNWIWHKMSSMSAKSAGAGGCTLHSFVETCGTMLPETL